MQLTWKNTLAITAFIAFGSLLTIYLDGLGKSSSVAPKQATSTTFNMAQATNITNFMAALSPQLAAYLISAEPFVPKKPNSIRINFEKTFDPLLIKQRQDVEKALAKKWVDVVQQNPAGSEPAEIWFYGSDGKYLDNFTAH